LTYLNGTSRFDSPHVAAPNSVELRFSNVYPDAFAKDKERLARFDREAKLLASLNHPNIASIYGLEESDGVKALILELGRPHACRAHR